VYNSFHISVNNKKGCCNGKKTEEIIKKIPDIHKCLLPETILLLILYNTAFQAGKQANPCITAGVIKSFFV
jgi:hypothetical protein